MTISTAPEIIITVPRKYGKGYFRMSGNGPAWDTFTERLTWLIGIDGRQKQEIAADAGVARSKISAWLKSQNPSLQGLEEIAEAFPAVSLRWLVTGQGLPFESYTGMLVERWEIDAGTLEEWGGPSGRSEILRKCADELRNIDEPLKSLFGAASPSEVSGERIREVLGRGRPGAGSDAPGTARPASGGRNQ